MQMVYLGVIFYFLRKIKKIFQMLSAEIFTQHAKCLVEHKFYDFIQPTSKYSVSSV